ncbi:MAG: hypothetical protein CSA20_09105 [Deltaproteobacteria bacterium]|nr:MAG: hypothetical protein CSA20_09105 [Deltaproteobacteria bacterium]
MQSLFFPATGFHSARQYPIFLLFPQIHLLRPSEISQVKGGENPTDILIRAGLCQAEIPCPLHEKLSVFQRLIEDIQERGDDYAAQLGTLILSGLSAEDTSAEPATHRTIIHQLLRADREKEKITEQKREARLWQARLILCLAEFLDREQEEIESGIASVAKESQDLFATLRGELDDITIEQTLAENSQEAGATIRHAGNIQLRLTAWRRLYEQSSQKTDRCLLTTSKDAADILVENYSKTAKTKGTEPYRIKGFTLPRDIGKDVEQAITRIQDFSEKNAQIQQEFQKQLLHLQREPDLHGALSGLRDDWNQQIEQTFPRRQHGRTAVTIFVFPEYPISSLLGPVDSQSRHNGILVLVG